jgi:hypothetical protein
MTRRVSIAGALALLLLFVRTPLRAAEKQSALQSLLDVLATGDQAAYERFVTNDYSAAALAEYPAPEHASSLARIYADTGGFTLDHVTSESLFLSLL